MLGEEEEVNKEKDPLVAEWAEQVEHVAVPPEKLEQLELLVEELRELHAQALKDLQRLVELRELADKSLRTVKLLRAVAIAKAFEKAKVGEPALERHPALS